MLLVTKEVQEALQWLQSRIQPWNIVVVKWAFTCQVRHNTLKSATASDQIANYFEQYKVLKQSLGYILVSDFFS